MSTIERIEELKKVIKSDASTVFEKIEAEQALDRLLGGTGWSGLEAKAMQQDSEELNKQ